MNWLVYHILSGHVFFTGVALLIIATLASMGARPVYGRISVLAFLLGIIAVILSSTPIPYWLCAVTIAATVAWIVSRYKSTWRRWASPAAIVVWLVTATLEIFYHFTPSLEHSGDRRITIIGDSVTAGIDGDGISETWPSILAREHQLQVQDISRMGETAGSILTRVKSHQITAPVVIVEIGGNDILGSTTSEQFATDLDALLTHLVSPHRQIIMFELPLPPFYHEYGRAQRSVAAKHKVRLVPKRVFLSIIAGSDSTLDTIHLSQAGHQFMADRVWRLIESAFKKTEAIQ